MKFKVGDRVRFIGDYTHYVEEALKNGEVYTISNIDEMGVELSVPMESYVDTEYLELAEPADPRSAFLQELKELMTKYDARIYPINGLLANGIGFVIGDDDVYYNLNQMRCKFITPDNIMDYEE